MPLVFTQEDFLVYTHIPRSTFQLSVMLPHEPSDLSGHYVVCALVQLLGWLVGCLTHKISNISSDLKNSKTKMCFRLF